jgi:hypothetical protein
MGGGSEHRTSYVVNGVLAGGVLLYALRLSRGDRGWIDLLVIGLVIAAIAWNVLQISRKLHRVEGRSGVWHVQRTVLFWIIGIFNTAMVRPGDVGSWKNWLGWLLVALAAMDTVLLFRRERAADGSAEPSTVDP